MTGEVAALTGAAAWAAATILFAKVGTSVRAANLNIIKGVLGCIFILVLFVLGSFCGLQTLDISQLLDLGGYDLFLLILSGVIGIGIGDTAYFGCLRRIGPQKGLMLESTAPIFTALLALLLFAEYLSTIAWLGILLTTAAVIWVVSWSRSEGYGKYNKVGLFLGLGAAASQATGVVLSRMVLSSGEVDPLASGFIRIFSGVVILFLGRFTVNMVVRRENRQGIVAALGKIVEEGLLLKLFLAVFLGTVLAIWMAMLALKYTDAGVAQALFGTCPLIGMIIGAWKGQKQPLSVWFGLLLGALGVGLIFCR